MFETIQLKAAKCLRGLARAPLLRRFVRHEKGTSAVEFSLIAAPFIALLFAIIETSMVFFAGQTLEAAVADSSRLIMTGQAEKFSAADFKTEVCKRIYGLFDCAGGIYVNVKSYPSFTSITTTPPVTNKVFNTTMAYDKPAVGDIVVVSLYYQWPIYVSLLGNNLDNLADRKRLLTATSVFRVEPYK
jgi:Flp pilus assembly protein TadG